jgi:hypothetical protein
MSGVSGVQVPINAKVDQTILLRVLNGAYNDISVTFPVDVVIIAWDGRALGVPPFGSYNTPQLVPVNTPIHISVARRFDCLIRTAVPVNSFATVEFIDTRGEIPGLPREVLMTARIPFSISLTGFSISGAVTGTGGAPLAGVAINLQGPVSKTVMTNALGQYSLGGLVNGAYTVTPTLGNLAFTQPSLAVTITNGDQVNQNFTAAAGALTTFALSGLVVGRGGTPLIGVTVNARGPVSASALTDETGRYTIAGLPNGSYSVLPSQAGFRFTPAKRSVTVSNANRTVAFFRGIRL